MIPVASTMTEVDNLPGEKEVNFSISTANSAWVMRSMADLYSNRELAVTREYSTNAYDAGKERALRLGTAVPPIEVTMPSVLNPYFTVRDKGDGMSSDTLMEVYTKFGESTKRDSNDFNGMLGFGSKSAIAYTNTFTVTSIHNGKKTMGVITRREDSNGGYVVTLKIILSDVPTTEHSGVEIQIPVHNWREFETKARDFYRFWQPGTVLVNGKEPKWDVGEKIDDNLYYYNQQTTGYYNQDLISYVVMGNVPYRIANPKALFPSGMKPVPFVAYVPNGAVEFTPSREDLKYSEHTKAALKQVIDDFITKSLSLARKEIDDAKDHHEAYRMWVKWQIVIGADAVKDLTYKGDKFVDSFDIDGWAYHPNMSRYNTDAITKWAVSNSEKTVFIVDFDNKEVTTNVRRIAKAWKNHKGLNTINTIVFTAEKTVDSPWIGTASVVEWEVVKDEAPKQVRKPRVKSTAPGRLAGTFDLITRKGRQSEKDVPIVKDLYYITVQDFNKHKNLSTVLDKFNLNHEVVLVPGNRKDKFLRNYKHAQLVIPELSKNVDFNGPGLLTPDAKKYLAVAHHWNNFLGTLDANLVDDPMIKEYIELAKKGEEVLLKDYYAQRALAHLIGEGRKFKEHKYDYWSRQGEPLKDYRLMNNIRSIGGSRDKAAIKEMYFYLNAVYAARKAGQNV